MAKSYHHSEMFAKLKRTEEQISDNYSSSQYLQVWELMIYKALEPIIQCSNIPDIILADTLSFLAEDARRKLSTADRADAITVFFLFLTGPSEKRIEYLKTLRLEKVILRHVINTFLTKTENYQALLTEYAKTNNKDTWLTLSQIETSIGYNKATDLFSAINTVRFWYKQSNIFKTQILEKYTRLILMTAQMHYKCCNSNLDLDDIVQTFSVFASRALDKFDPDKGSLTSYVQQWLHHAKGVVSTQETGVAFLIPSEKKMSQPYYSMPLDCEEVLSIPDDSVENLLESSSERQRIQKLAKLVDPLGLGRLALGISEYFSSAELLELGVNRA